MRSTTQGIAMDRTFVDKIHGRSEVGLTHAGFSCHPKTLPTNLASIHGKDLKHQSTEDTANMMS